jgi:Leucine-rich repeat (LRR) protein
MKTLIIILILVALFFIVTQENFDISGNLNLLTNTEARFDKPIRIPISADPSEDNEIPKQIGDLNELEILDVQQNLISKIDVNLYNLKNLKKLMLNVNNITELSDSIGFLINLEYLNLGSNILIPNLPESIGNLSKLQTLFANNANLGSIPKEIGNLTNLVEFNLSSNKIDSLPLEIGNLQ